MKSDVVNERKETKLCFFVLWLLIVTKLTAAKLLLYHKTYGMSFLIFEMSSCVLHPAVPVVPHLSQAPQPRLLQLLPDALHHRAVQL